MRSDGSALSLRRWVRSAGFAWAGLRHVYRTQANFRIEVWAGVLALALAAWLRAPLSPILLACGLVLSVELLNTALEAVVDLASPGQHPLAKVAKDAGRERCWSPAWGRWGSAWRCWGRRCGACWVGDGPRALGRLLPDRLSRALGRACGKLPGAMEPPSSGSALTPGQDRLRAAFLLWPPRPATDALPVNLLREKATGRRAACATRHAGAQMECAHS